MTVMMHSKSALASLVLSLALAHRGSAFSIPRSRRGQQASASSLGISRTSKFKSGHLSIPLSLATKTGAKHSEFSVFSGRHGQNGHRRTLVTQLRSTSVSTSSPSSSPRRATAVYALMLINLLVFVADKFSGSTFIKQNFYLFHHKWLFQWWQILTSAFCHADRDHLANNLLLLLLFGRSVEDDLGWGGLVLSYLWCAVVSSLVSLWILPKYTISLGASGAVFGLFVVSTLTKLTSWREFFNWRKIVELSILGDFVFRQITEEVRTAAGGGLAGVNHVAHLSGAAAGAILVLGMRKLVYDHERAEKVMLTFRKQKKSTTARTNVEATAERAKVEDR